MLIHLSKHISYQGAFAASTCVRQALSSRSAIRTLTSIIVFSNNNIHQSTRQLAHQLYGQCRQFSGCHDADQSSSNYQNDVHQAESAASSGTYHLVQLGSRKLIRLTGYDCFAYLQLLTTNNIQSNFNCQSSFLVNENGRILADMLIYKLSGDVFDKELTLSGLTRKNYGRRIVDCKLQQPKPLLTVKEYRLRERQRRREEKAKSAIFAGENVQTANGDVTAVQALTRQQFENVDDVETLLIECDSQVADALAKTLYVRMTKEQIHIELLPNYSVFCIYPANTGNGCSGSYSAINLADHLSDHLIITRDPRLPQLGYRFLASFACDVSKAKEYLESCSMFALGQLQHADEKDYRLYRYKIGVGEGLHDFGHAETFCLEMNADYLNGVSFHKCNFIGQVPTGRVYGRQYLRNRLLPFELLSERAGDVPISRHSSIRLQDGKPAGKVLRTHGRFGIGVFHIDVLRRAANIDVRQQQKQPTKFCNLELPMLIHHYSRCPIRLHFPDWWPTTDQLYRLTVKTYEQQLNESLKLIENLEVAGTTQSQHEHSPNLIPFSGH